MSLITETTWATIRDLFPTEQHANVANILATECGNNLPFQENADAKRLERFHLAALKLSEGTITGLQKAVQLAKVDWRDLLMAAEAADKPRNRRKWRFLR
jgi:hypothetical protein